MNKDAGILVPPKNVDSLKEAIDYMLDHHQEYSSKKISQYASNRFSYEVVGKELDKIYRKLKNETIS